MTSPNTQSGEDLRPHLIDWLSRRGNVEEVVNLIHQRESSLLDEVEKRGPKDLTFAGLSDTKLSTCAMIHNDCNHKWRQALQTIRKERGL